MLIGLTGAVEAYDLMPSKQEGSSSVVGLDKTNQLSIVIQKDPMKVSISCHLVNGGLGGRNTVPLAAMVLGALIVDVTRDK